jgi:hypothetical protein
MLTTHAVRRGEQDENRAEQRAPKAARKPAEVNFVTASASGITRLAGQWIPSSPFTTGPPPRLTPDARLEFLRRSARRSRRAANSAKPGELANLSF